MYGRYNPAWAWDRRVSIPGMIAQGSHRIPVGSWGISRGSWGALVLVGPGDIFGPPTRPSDGCSLWSMSGGISERQKCFPSQLLEDSGGNI